MMLVVKMAAEFQGFTRELHDKAAEFLSQSVVGGNQTVANTLQVGLTSERALNRNNAGPQTIATDFARIGLIFWPAILTKEPTNGPVWRADLQSLIEMRNAIAHDNQAKLVALESAGSPLSEPRVRSWHGSLSMLAATMDDVVASYLAALLGVPKPW